MLSLVKVRLFNNSIQVILTTSNLCFLTALRKVKREVAITCCKPVVVTFRRRLAFPWVGLRSCRRRFYDTTHHWRWCPPRTAWWCPLFLPPRWRGSHAAGNSWQVNRSGSVSLNLFTLNILMAGHGGRPISASSEFLWYSVRCFMWLLFNFITLT